MTLADSERKIFYLYRILGYLVTVRYSSFCTNFFICDFFRLKFFK